MTLAPLPGSPGTRRLEVSDSRADERRRVVLIARDRVVIARSVAGVFMRIQLMPSAYRGILLRLASLDDAGFHYEIHLTHDDPDFGVLLARSDDEAEALAEWDLWSRFLLSGGELAIALGGGAALGALTGPPIPWPERNSSTVTKGTF